MRERQGSGQDLVWAATKTLAIPDGWKIIALRPEIWGPAVHAQVTDQDGQSLSAEVSEFDTVEDVAVKIEHLIDELTERARQALAADAREHGLRVEPTPETVLMQRDVVKPDWRHRRTYAARRVRDLVTADPEISAEEIAAVLELEDRAAQLGVDLVRADS